MLTLLMAALVAQKIKAGVSTVPCGVSSRPSLAKPIVVCVYVNLNIN
jgi:hypothetical protein